MVRIAIIAVLLTMIRWNAGLTVLAVIITFVPSFAWADTGGRFRRSDQPRGTLDERLTLLTQAWMFSTLGLIAAVSLASQFYGIDLSRM